MNGDDDHDGEVEEDDEDDKLVTTFNIKSIYKNKSRVTILVFQLSLSIYF